ncbi:Proteasome subunit alpha type-5-B [Dendrobium catenatum]|uniref:Proteasome subunit alpha type n=1 Tax=Dendrobium catenatum TaxID=906689 RepID=A0A2I0V7P4_9ASPA|nr:Proteasome subunit alpha type-5-B [Dendrobium catenatum]
MIHVFVSRTEYDRGVNTFSPEGRLLQVEYAIEAIKLGATAIGIKTKQGVVLAVEKRLPSPLLEPSSVEKIMEIDEHIGCAMSGFIADARTLVEHARVETQNHRFSYGEPMTVESTTQALCDHAIRFGEGEEESMSRPFGVSLLIAGHDEHGPSPSKAVGMEFDQNVRRILSLLILGHHIEEDEEEPETDLVHHVDEEEDFFCEDNPVDLQVIKCVFSQSKPSDDWRRTSIFHTFTKIGDKSYKVIIDSGSCINGLFRDDIQI